MKEPIGFTNAKVVKRVILRQMCWECWDKTFPSRRPTDITIDQLREETVCCDCGRKTKSGIYVRREVFLDEGGQILPVAVVDTNAKKED